jgi:hypothetical protein
MSWLRAGGSHRTGYLTGSGVNEQWTLQLMRKYNWNRHEKCSIDDGPNNKGRKSTD